jgi:hypothetical protein
MSSWRSPVRLDVGNPAEQLERAWIGLEIFAASLVGWVRRLPCLEEAKAGA